MRTYTFLGSFSMLVSFFCGFKTSSLYLRMKPNEPSKSQYQGKNHNSVCTPNLHDLIRNYSTTDIKSSNAQTQKPTHCLIAFGASIRFTCANFRVFLAFVMVPSPASCSTPNPETTANEKSPEAYQSQGDRTDYYERLVEFSANKVPVV